MTEPSIVVTAVLGTAGSGGALYGFWRVVDKGWSHWLAGRRRRERAALVSEWASDHGYDAAIQMLQTTEWEGPAP